MRSIAFAAPLLAFAWISSSTPAHATPGGRTLPDEFVPLERGTWVAGFAGSIGRTDDRVRPHDGRELGILTDGFRFTVNSRNGYFLARRFLVGLDFQLTVTSATTNARSGGQQYEISDYEERLFVGPWLRYYVPMSNAWAFFPEFSWGLQRAYRSQQAAPNVPAEEDRSSGLSFNLGVGFTHFFTRNIAFDATGRYSRGRLRGSFGGVRAGSDVSDIAILIGFQVYLPEFTF
jgi:opacity protein-like surface antigen